MSRPALKRKAQEDIRLESEVNLPDVYAEQQPELPNQVPDRITVACERLRHTHLERGSFYCGMRSMLPIPAMAVLWAWIAQHDPTVASAGLLGMSITVRHLLLAAGILALWNVSLSLSPHRRRSIQEDLRAEIGRLFCASLVSGLLLSVSDLGHFSHFQARTLAYTLSLTLLAAACLLLCAAFCVSARLMPKNDLRTALIIGSGDRAEQVRSRLEATNTRLSIIGCLDDEYMGSNSSQDNYLGPLNSLATILKLHPVEMVLIGLPVKSKYQQIQDVIAVCESVGVESHYLADVFDTRATPQPSAHSRAFTVLSTFTADPRLLVKRVMDIAGAFTLLILTAPVMAVVALSIKFTNPGPIFFVQKRYGLHRKQFTMFKFRTMQIDAEQHQASLEALNEADGPTFKLKADPRITTIGTLLRRSSIDELPQLLNVLLGEMSLVGPRPLPVRDVSGFDESWLLRRFSVRPGLTCLWQVRGRSNISFVRWMELDLEYIDRWSILGDLVILAQTIPAVLRGRGAM